MVFLGIITAAITAFVVWKKPAYGLFLISALLPTYLLRFSFGPLPSTILEMAVAGFVIAGSVKMIKEKIWRLPPRPITALAAAWIIFAAITLFWTPSLKVGLGYWKAFFMEPALVFFTAYALIKPQRQILKSIAIGLGVSGLSLAIIGILQPVFSGFGVAPPYWDLIPARITSVFPQPNMLALFIGPLTAPLIAVALREKERMIRWCALILFIIGWQVIALTYSLGALLGLAAAFVFVLIVHRPTRIYTTVFLVLGAVFVLSQSQIRSRIEPTFKLEDWSGKVRMIQWKEAFSFIKDHPIKGAGLAGYKKAIEPYHAADYIEIFPYPHNIFLNIFVELGIFGLLIFLSILAYVCLVLIKNRQNPWVLPITTSWIVLIVHGLVDIPYFKNDLSVFFWLLILMTVISAEERINYQVNINT